MGQPRVAVLGLGIMGAGMANNLLRAGFPVNVYNRDAAKSAPFASTAGARVATSPGDAASDADVVISMVSDDRASRAVWMGEQGALSGVKKGALLIESSTLTVAWVEELSKAAQSAGVELIDAPVTGSRDHAAAGQLLFLVGGSADALERAKPVLSVMSRGIVHLGPTGSGALMKLINNFVCGVQAAALAEGIRLIEQSDLGRDQALDVLYNGAPGSPLVKTLGPRMAARDFQTFFFLKLMEKDLTYAREEAARRGLTLETATAAISLFDRAIADGHGDKDFTAIVESVR
jgi:3-hydroxyisobutyrate dehydrogenase